MGQPNITIPATLGNGSTQSSQPSINIDDKYYKTDATLWYQALPYRFVLWKQNGTKMMVNLPISPNNIQVNTRMATTVIPTLYGIVEDHSNVRFFDITIQGTTGIAPQYVGIQGEGPQQPTSGRDSFSADSAVPSLGGLLPEVTNMIKQVKKVYSEITADGNNIPNQSGVGIYSTGYYAFHSLYKFFLEYKDECVNGLSTGPEQSAGLADKAKDFVKNKAADLGSKKSSAQASPKAVATRNTHPLEFYNFKDNQKYNVVPVAFVLNRSADNPMLYNYSIKLVAFNLSSANSNTGNNDASFMANLKAQLGLGGLDGSTFSKLANKARSASSVLSRIGIGR